MLAENQTLTVPIADGASLAPTASRAVFSDEDLEMLQRMTLIVGMIGTKGIVLAADRNAVEFSLVEKEIDRRFDEGKIIHIERYGVVFACAGDYVSQLVPEALETLLLKHSDDPNYFATHIKESLQKAADDALDLYAEKTHIGARPIRRQLFVALCSSNAGISPQLWALEVRPDKNSGAREIADWKLELGGAMGNGAGFFRSYWKPDLSIEKMTELAGHIVLAANRWDSLIEGLDITTISRDSGCHKLTTEEKERIRGRYQHFDQTMTRLFN